MKFTLAHVIIGLFTILIIVIVSLNWESSSSIILTSTSWCAFIMFAFITALAFDKLGLKTQFLIGFLSLIVLLAIYYVLRTIFPSIILQIDLVILFVFVSLFGLIFASSQPAINSSNLPFSPSKLIPKTIKLIIDGKIKNSFDLKVFYKNEPAEKGLTYDRFLFLIYHSAISCENEECNVDKVKSLIEPLIHEMEEHKPYDMVNTKERLLIQNIHSIAKREVLNNHEQILGNLESLSQAIYENQIRLDDEKKKNKQSLIVSWVGIFLTVILSIISIIISLTGYRI